MRMAVSSKSGRLSGEEEVEGEVLMQLDVYNMKGEIVDKIELSDDIFAIEPNGRALSRRYRSTGE